MHYSIGEFSRISSLTIKSLRLYHERGLLIPAHIDAASGYRYYNDSNFEIARAIRILREHEFSLTEIADILSECRDEADMLGHLQKKVGELREKIDRYKTLSHSLETIIRIEQESAMTAQENFDIEEKNLETLLIAGFRMKGRYNQVGDGFKVLGKSFGRYAAGKPLTLYYDSEYKEDDADFEPCFPVRKGTSTDTVTVRELPGGKAVTLLHKGPYETISSSYRLIFAYINEHGYTPHVPSREVYIKGPGMIFRGNPNNYLTEIQVLVNKGFVAKQDDQFHAQI